MPISRLSRLLVSFAVLPCLTGCVSLKLGPDTANFSKQPPSARQTQLTKIQTWNIDGAFSFKSQGKVNLANYSWQQRSPTDYLITLDSALHLYRVTVQGTAHQVKLVESEQHVMTARTPEALLEKRLHTRLPIQALRFWIRGLPAPGHYQADYDRWGHLDQLQQAGWQVQFDHYARVGSVDLPQRLSIQGPGQQIKLVIKSWSL